MDRVFDYYISLSGTIQGVPCRDEFVHLCEGYEEAKLYAEKKAHELFDPGFGGITGILVVGPVV